ncbi:MAG: diacylglycerol kinase [Betaproteobacteria bacterium]|nr:diacylglycerol kinase [Betaproteobacteria bacterium]NBT74981.1 diacylglycerol kinase [Betaproteobacteria bacterium]NBY14271.1 diacylglycerol kinase [Betaproteobacteria bacterium]NCA15712.1 diacylglycerol kinase [Betaproteobacteria bacterium]NDF04082.1 diacylglycerol kinase [Betaproteobacteria bacterium]
MSAPHNPPSRPAGYSPGHGLKRLWPALINSVRGIRYTFLSESAFRLEVAGFACLSFLLVWLPFFALERLVLAGAMVLVLIVELLNTGIELCIDRISAERHPLSGFAKDAASAAVFLSLAFCGSCWITLLVALWQRS